MKNAGICFLMFLFCFGLFATEEPGSYTISGYVKDAASGEALIGAGIYVKEIRKGTVTNAYGYYALTLQPGTYHLVFSYVGYVSQEKMVVLQHNLTLNIEMATEEKQLQTVVVTSEKADENVVKPEMSIVKMDVKTIKSVPALAGEIDPIKVIQLLPGVQPVSEGSSGFSVRGGAADQNLVLLDEATVYNASHALGFLSVFNNDAIKDIKLYKGDIPVQYGGRLSSLLDVRQKDGNMKHFAANGGLGMITSRLTLEGPLVKDRSSVMAAGRLAYPGLFFPFSPNPVTKKAKLYFYDLNLKGNYILSQKDRLFVSAYAGRDMLAILNVKFGWGNKTFTARWNHLFSDRLFCNTSIIYSDYDYLLSTRQAGFQVELTAGMKDWTLRHDYTFYLNPNNTLSFGFQSIFHTFMPGEFNPGGENNSFAPFKVQTSRALEHALYVGNQQKAGEKLTIEYGVRYSFMQNIGPQRVYLLNAAHEIDRIDTISSHRIYYTHAGWEGFEPRAGFTFLLTSRSSIKGNYMRSRQFVQLASNSVIGFPLDLWVPCSPNIKPQTGDQYAIGFFRNFFDNRVEGSVELYYKSMQNQIDFRDFAQITFNEQIDKEFRTGKAKSYGIELLLRKQSGKLQGWTGYTYSRAKRYFPEINGGKPYSAPYDRPHTLSVVIMYNLTPSFQLSANWIYYTGTAITMPTGKYNYEGQIVGIVSQRNGYRLPDYHRLDLGITWKQKEKPGKKFYQEVILSVYNVYNRKNPWMIDYGPDEKDPSKMKFTQIVIFPRIPSLSWNFRF